MRVNHLTETVKLQVFNTAKDEKEREAEKAAAEAAAEKAMEESEAAPG